MCDCVVPLLGRVGRRLAHVPLEAVKAVGVAALCTAKGPHCGFRMQPYTTFRFYYYTHMGVFAFARTLSYK